MTKTRTNTKDPFAARLRHSTSAWMRENVSVSEYMTENSSNHMAFVCMIEDLNIINSIKNRENNKYVPLSLSSMDDLEEYSVENTTTPVGMPSRHIITCTTITIADMTTTTSNNNHLMCQRFYFLPSLHKYVLHELVHFNTNYSTPIELRYHHDFGHQSLHTNPDLILMQCPILMTCLVGAKISFDAQSQLFDRGNSHPQERRNGIRMPLLLLLISTAAKDQVIEIDSVLSAISQILTCDDEWYTWRVEVGERWDEFVDVAEGGFNKLDEGEFDSTVCVWDNGERIGLDTAPDLIARTLTAGAINTSSAPTHDPTHDFAFKLLFVVSVKPLVSYVFASYPCAIVKLGVTALTRHLQIVVLLRTDPMGVFCPIQVAACVGLFAIKSAPHDVISRVAFLAHVDIPLCILVTQCLAKYPLANEIRDSFIATSVTLWGEFLCDQVYTDEMLQTITIRHEMLPTITIRHCRNEKLRTTLKTIMVMERGWGVTDNMAVDVAIGWRAAVIITCVYTLAKELIAMLLPSIHYHPLMVLIHAHTVMGHDRPTVGKCGTARQSSVHASNAIVDIYHYRVEAHTMHIVLVYNCRHDTNRSLHLQSTDMGTEGIFHTLRECCISTEIIARFTHRLNYVYDALDNEGNSDAVEDLIIYSDDDDDERTPHTDRFYRPLNYGEQSVTYKAIVCLALVATRHCWLRLCEVGLALNDPANNSAGTNPITTSPSIHDLVDDEQHAVLDAFPMIDCADDYMGLGISGWLIVENISMGAMMPCMLLSGEVFVRVKRLYRLLRNAAATNLPTHMFTTPLIKEICYVSESCSDGDVAVVVAMSTLCDLHIVGRAKIDDRLSSVSAATTPLGGVFSANGIITDVHTFCHDVSVSADAAPVDDIHILLGTSTVDCVDERSGLVSRMGVITGWIAAENIIINAMMKRMLLWGEIWYDCFNSEMFGYSIVGITGNHWRLLILTWLPPVHLSGFVMMDFVDEHDRLAPSVIAVSGWKDTLKPTVAGGEREESTVKMILFWGEQYGCLADDKEVIGISALYGSQSYGEIELCIGVQNTVYSWGAVYVVIPQTDTVMITDLRVSDVPVGLQPSADDTITCVHMPRSKVSGHYCSELSDSNHRLRVLTSMWSPISTSVALHDILDSVIDPSYDDDNSDGLVIPCFTAYSNSVASSHKKRLSLIDCINWRTEHTSQQDDMIGLGDHSAQLKDGLHQPVSWGARYNRYPDYESDYDILAGVDVFDDRVVDNYFFCGCDDDGSMFDMDEDSMQYDTGAGYDTRVDLLCITTDTPADGHVMIDGNSYLQVTILDTRFAADRAFTGTMVCRCADLFCEETLSSRYTPLDVEIYAVRTTLEKTMIKSTSHCLEVLFQGQSTSPGYDDPTTTEDILFARRRPMFLTSVVDDKLRHDMVNSKSYVVITHDCLHKHHCMLTHHCITGCAASSTGQREHIDISAGYNYGDVLSKIWTYYRDAWILLLGELVWKRDMMDLALFNRI